MNNTYYTDIVVEYLSEKYTDVEITDSCPDEVHIRFTSIDENDYSQIFYITMIFSDSVDIYIDLDSIEIDGNLYCKNDDELYEGFEDYSHFSEENFEENFKDFIQCINFCRTAEETAALIKEVDWLKEKYYSEQLDFIRQML